MDPKARIAKIRKDLKKRLGLDFSADRIKDIIKEEDITASMISSQQKKRMEYCLVSFSSLNREIEEQKKRQADEILNQMLQNTEGLSAREKNKIKRKAKQAAK